MGKKIPLSKEQQDIMEGFSDAPGHVTCILARAGSGKTHTLINIVKDCCRGKKVLMTSFNKNAVVDLQTALRKHGLSTGIDCRTLHSICYGEFFHGCKPIRPIAEDAPTIYENLVPYYFGGPISKSRMHSIGAWFAIHVKNWFKSRNYTIQSFVEELYLTKEEIDLGIDRNILFDMLTSVHNNTIYGQPLRGDEHGQIRLSISHNAYAKAIQLKKIKLDYDVIFIDECQDCLGPMIEIINLQDHCAKVTAGDPGQQIYEWNGAIDALDAMARGSRVENYRLSRSFRCPAEVVEYSNLLLKAMKEGVLMRPKLVNVRSANPQTRVLAHSNWGALTFADELRQKGIKYRLDTMYTNMVSNDPHKRALAGDLRKTVRDMDKWLNGCITGIESPVVFNLVKVFKHNHQKAYEMVRKSDKGLKQMMTMGYKSKGHLYDKFKEIVHGSSEDAEITISTVHQSKGHEWENVIMLDDFPDFNQYFAEPPKRPSEKELLTMDNLKVRRAWESNPNLERVIDIEQFRIQYVAATRASESLTFQDPDNIPIPTDETRELMEKLEEEGKLKIV